MDADTELLLQIAAQARNLSAGLEGGGCAQGWAQGKVRLDALLSCTPHSLIAAADIAADLHTELAEVLPPHLTA